MTFIKGLLIASFLYNLLLMVIYFSKARVDNVENTIYSYLLSSNLVGILLEFFCLVFAGQMKISGSNIKESFYVVIFARAYLLYLLLWVYLYMLYVYSISVNPEKKIYVFIEKHKKQAKRISFVILGIFTILLLTLPMYFYNDGKAAYTWGPSINMLLVLFTTSVLFSIANMLMGYKKSRFKKYLPVISFFICVSLVVITKSINQEIQLVSTILTFTTILMYFVIENPDLKMVKELENNRNIIEKSYESNANFIFNVSQEVKNPIQKIENYYDALKGEKLSSKVNNLVDNIKEESDNLKFIVSNFLDISSLDAHDIKLINNKYNLYNLLKRIEINAKSSVATGVEFRISISPNTPEHLYGDDVKIKQILTTIINNSIKYTTEGFIELSVETITKYDACRLMFTIEDSGKGMSLGKVNDLMKNESDLNDNELDLLDSLNLNVNLVKKITKLIGGHIMIKSEPNKGTRFIIVLEQTIPSDDQMIKSQKKSISVNTKKVLLVSNSKTDVSNFKKVLSKNNIMAIVSMYSKDALLRIDNEEQYNMILIEDEMPDMSGITLLKELRKMGCKNKCVVMMRESKLKIKDVYLEDGFDDYLNKDDFVNELKRVIDDYI